MLRSYKVVLPVLAILAIAGSAYTFVTQSSVVNRTAGNRTNLGSSYTVTNVIYNIDAVNPNIVDAIRFEIAPNAGTGVAAIVKVQTSDGGAWTDCAVSGGTLPPKEVTCTFESLELEDATALNIVASSTELSP